MDIKEKIKNIRNDNHLTEHNKKIMIEQIKVNNLIRKKHNKNYLYKTINMDWNKLK